MFDQDVKHSQTVMMDNLIDNTPFCPAACRYQTFNGPMLFACFF